MSGPLNRVRRLSRKIGYRLGPRLMSALRKRWVLFRHPHATIIFEGPVYLGPGFSLHIPDNGTFIVGPGVEFRRNFRAEIHGEGVIRIGGACSFTYDAIVSCATKVEIGERCLLSHAFYLADGNHRFRDFEVPVLQQGYNFREISIGDDVVVLSKCTVTNSIGTRSVIGANSMVAHEIPPYCLAGGVPARVIEYFGPPGQEPGQSVAGSSS